MKSAAVLNISTIGFHNCADIHYYSMALGAFISLLVNNQIRGFFPSLISCHVIIILL